MKPLVPWRALAVCIIFLITSTFASANLITNGGFETGNFDGWSVSNGPAMPPSVDSNNPHSGNWDAFFPATNNINIGTAIWQDVSTTPGETYTLSFFLLDTGDGSSFKVTFGSPLTPTFINNPGSSPYTIYNVNFTAVSTSTLVRLEAAGFESPWYLDDVSVNLASVSEGGSSALLLGLALAGLVLVQRRLGSQKVSGQAA